MIFIYNFKTFFKTRFYNLEPNLWKILSVMEYIKK